MGLESTQPSFRQPEYPVYGKQTFVSHTPDIYFFG